MVLESLIPSRTAEQQPIEMLPITFLFCTIAIFIALWVFPNYASLTLVFFTVMALLPLMIHIIQLEERSLFESEITKFEHHHKRTLPFFVYMFLGMVIAFSFWFIALPAGTVSSLFSVQMSTIHAINNNVQQIAAGNVVNIASYYTAVLGNNIKVLAFVLLFSFIYGAGAIFILTWNASVVAVAIGNAFRRVISSAAAAGNVGVGTYFSAFSLGLMRYMIHGIPEIGAYFIGGLAGGMISVAVLKHTFMDEKFKRVMFDSLNLVLFAVGMLVVAALLESFVSPLVPI